MSTLQPNFASAVEASSYYNQLWSQFGTDLHYLEVNRARFVVESIQEFVGYTGLKILDLGCGRGWMAPFLAPLGSVIGIDFAPLGIRLAQERYGKHAKFLVADPKSSTLGLPSDLTFDVVVCSEVIEHVPVHSDLIMQIHKFLRPSGWCVLTTPNGNVWPQYDSIPEYKAAEQPIENWLTTKQLKSLFKQMGFHVMRHEGQPFYEFRPGLTGYLQKHRLNLLCNKMGLNHLYGRLILPTALYQVVTAQKK